MKKLVDSVEWFLRYDIYLYQFPKIWAKSVILDFPRYYGLDTYSQPFLKPEVLLGLHKLLQL